MKNPVKPPVVRAGGAISSLFIPLGALLIGALTTVLVTCKGEDGFECGTPFPSDSTVARTCDRPREVCVCETNSCATRVDPSDCPSGLRYVEEPFARADLAGACAKLQQPLWLVTTAQPGSLCPAEAPDASATTTGTGGAPGTGGSAGSAPLGRHAVNHAEDQQP